MKWWICCAGPRVHLWIRWDLQLLSSWRGIYLAAPSSRHPESGAGGGAPAAPRGAAVLARRVLIAARGPPDESAIPRSGLSARAQLPVGILRCRCRLALGFHVVLIRSEVRSVSIIRNPGLISYLSTGIYYLCIFP